MTVWWTSYSPRYDFRWRDSDIKSFLCVPNRLWPEISPLICLTRTAHTKFARRSLVVLECMVARKRRLWILSPAASTFKEWIFSWPARRRAKIIVPQLFQSTYGRLCYFAPGVLELLQYISWTVSLPRGWPLTPRPQPPHRLSVAA